MTWFPAMTRLMACSTLAVPALAFGGWISSGGEVLQDANNPWFINNTQTVSYCIDRDEKHFSGTLEDARAVTRAALDYWRMEFAYADHVIAQSRYEIRVAQQNFVETSCDGDVDLRFLYGKFPENPPAGFSLPRSTIARAVRTNYDEVNLKGRGFIYVAPDSGPQAFERTEHMPASPWSKRRLLLNVVAHELGHVFGISHLEGYGNLMNAGRAEFVLEEYRPHPDYDRKLALPSFFSFWADPTGGEYQIKSCGGDFPVKLKEFLGYEGRAQCQSLQGPLGAEHGRKLYAWKDMRDDTPAELVGEFMPHKKEWIFSWQRLVNVRLTPRQRVFPDLEPYVRSLPGPDLQQKIWRGEYRGVNGVVRQVGIIQLPSREVRILGAAGDDLFLDVIQGQ